MQIILPIRRLVALSMALLITCTSVGYSIDLHYCMGKLKSYAFFGKAKACYERAETIADCPLHAAMAKPAIERKNCCEDKQFFFQCDQDQVRSTIQSILTTGSILTGLVPEASSLFFDIVLYFQPADLQYYKPPLLAIDRPVLFEFFLL